MILDEANRNSRMSGEELSEIDWEGPPLDVAALKVRWLEALHDARSAIEKLPGEAVGRAVLARTGEIFRGDATELTAALQVGQLHFHSGHIGGVWPQIKP